MCRCDYFTLLQKNSNYNFESASQMKKESAAKPTVIRFEDCCDYDAVCPHDSLHFKTAEEWKNHHLGNHMDTNWRCPLCGTKSYCWYNYSYHVQTSDHKWICPPPWICKLSFEHRHSSTGESRCGARYGSKYQLIRHIRDCHANYKVKSAFSEFA